MCYYLVEGFTLVTTDVNLLDSATSENQPTNAGASAVTVRHMQICAGTSIFCFGLFIIFMLKLEKWKSTPDKLGILLNTCVLGESIALVLGDLEGKNPSCNLQAWLVTFSEWAGLMCAMCIIFHRYNFIKNGEGNDDSINKMTICKKEIKYTFAIYVVLIFFVANLFSLIPFFDEKYGPSGAWCWIEYGNPRSWILGIWYGEVIAIMILTLLFGLYRLWEYCDKYHANEKDRKEMLKHQERIGYLLIA